MIRGLNAHVLISIYCKKIILSTLTSNTTLHIITPFHECKDSYNEVLFSPLPEKIYKWPYTEVIPPTYASQVMEACLVNLVADELVIIGWKMWQLATQGHCTLSHLGIQAGVPYNCHIMWILV